MTATWSSGAASDQCVKAVHGFPASGNAQRASYVSSLYAERHPHQLIFSSSSSGASPKVEAIEKEPSELYQWGGDRVRDSILVVKYDAQEYLGESNENSVGGRFAWTSTRLNVGGKEEFVSRLLRLLNVEPVVEGFLHPAEDLISNALRHSSEKAMQWIQEVFFQNLYLRPSISADLLKCLTGLESDLAGNWAFSLAVSGLRSQSIELREAAVRFFENRGGSDSFNALLDYLPHEDVDWMTDYIKGVITDLAQ